MVSTRSGMQTHLQCIEGERAIDRVDQFAIEHKCLWRAGTYFPALQGKARQRFSDLALISTSLPTETQGSENDPTWAGTANRILWQLGDELGFHRSKVEGDSRFDESGLPLSGCKRRSLLLQ